MDGRSQIKVHTNERTQVHVAQSSVDVWNEDLQVPISKCAAAATTKDDVICDIMLESLRIDHNRHT